MGFPGGSDGKESACNAGDLGLIPGLGRSLGGRIWQLTAVFLPGESPWSEGPGELQSMGSKRVGHDSVTKYRTAHVIIILCLKLISVKCDSFVL